MSDIYGPDSPTELERPPRHSIDDFIEHMPKAYVEYLLKLGANDELLTDDVFFNITEEKLFERYDSPATRAAFEDEICNELAYQQFMFGDDNE